MASAPPSASASPKLDRYLVIHVATTCDEHGVYVTKDSAEVIELGWILLDSKTCDEVSPHLALAHSYTDCGAIDCSGKYSGKAGQYTHHSSLQ